MLLNEACYAAPARQRTVTQHKQPAATRHRNTQLSLFTRGHHTTTSLGPAGQVHHSSRTCLCQEVHLLRLPSHRPSKCGHLLKCNFKRPLPSNTHPAVGKAAGKVLSPTQLSW